MRLSFTGLGTALITPFTRAGAVDEAATARLAKRQAQAGVHFMVPCGTTGEAPTLSSDEKRRVVEIVADAVEGRAMVLAGAGGYDTREVIHVGRRHGARRRTRHPLRHALLQPSHARRALPALPRDRGEHQTTDHRLQRARSHGLQRRARHAGCDWPASRTSWASRKRPATCRRWPTSVASCRLSSWCCRVTTCWRCRLMAIGGQGLDLGRVQRSAGRDGADDRGRRARRLSDGAPVAPRAHAADAGELRRGQPDSREVRDGVDGAVRRGLPAADGVAGRRRPNRRSSRCSRTSACPSSPKPRV